MYTDSRRGESQTTVSLDKGRKGEGMLGLWVSRAALGAAEGSIQQMRGAGEERGGNLCNLAPTQSCVNVIFRTNNRFDAVV